MKTLLSYIFVMSVSTISICSTVNAQEKKVDFVSHLSSRTLSNEDFPTTMEIPPLSISPTLESRTQETTSLIYLANLSEAIDHQIMAFNLQDQEYFYLAFKKLNAGRLSQLPVQKTNSLSALLHPKWLSEMVGSHQFSPNVKALTKLPYETKGNWGVSPPLGG